MQPPKRTTFHAVRDEVKRRIEARIWPQGALLPTETELAEEFGCARATVNRALRELAEQGFVERRRKSGTRVKIAPVKHAKIEIAVVRQTVEDQNAVYRYALVERSVSEAPAWLTSQLGIKSGTRVLHLLCMHYADNRPFQFEERWINITTVPDIEHADLTTVGPNEWLLNAVPFTDAEITFSAVSTDSKLSDFLATAVGTPVIQLERTTWLQGKPVTYVRMTHHPGYRFRTQY
ncbi:GntR family transcriptional regulator [Tropicibacter sp. Alg240-R139]|uniref:GntR family transcriptional regulator n=1 Tax=Tropicibacter sp. Alg240-R139 TaxID=2305991 RepID=UPI0013E0ADB3|nr:GntR family transcriptional regulator [Tropicibacter sp. Alg240-R139]